MTSSVPLKICFVIQSAGGGAQRHLVDLIDELLQLGHRIHLIANTDPLCDVYGERFGKHENFSWERISLSRSIGLSDIGAAWRVRRAIRRCDPFDIVHGHSSKGGAIARLAGIFGQARVFYTPHAFYTLNPELSKKKRIFYGTVERILAKITHGIVPVSNEEHDHACELGIAEHKLHTIPNGVPPISFPSRDAARGELGIRDDQFCVGFIGRMELQKYPELLIEATRPLFEKYPQLVVAMIGDGELREKLMQETTDLRDRILWLGSRNGVQCLPAFDIFALSSRYEGFPYVYLEALAAGVPIITTRVGGQSAAVIEGKTGYVVELNDAPALGKAISRTIDDPTLLAQMKAGALEHSKNFTARTMAERTVEAYREKTKTSLQ